MIRNSGILADRAIGSLFGSGRLISETMLDADQIQPASLDLRLGAPDAGHVRFQAPGDAEVERDQAPDLARAIDRFSPFVLPDPLAGEPRRTRVAGAASTYGRGFDLVAVLAFPASLSPRTRAFLDKVPTRDGPWGAASVIAWPCMMVEGGSVGTGPSSG